MARATCAPGAPWVPAARGVPSPAARDAGPGLTLRRGAAVFASWLQVAMVITNTSLFRLFVLGWVTEIFAKIPFWHVVKSSGSVIMTHPSAGSQRPSDARGLIKIFSFTLWANISL